MAGHHLEIAVYITALLVVLLTGFHGLCVWFEWYGYRRDPRYKWHPELKGLKLGDRLLVYPRNNDSR